MENLTNSIKVIPKNTNESIQIDSRIQNKSEFIKKTIEDNPTDPIPLDITKEVLAKVITHMEHYNYGDIKALEKPVKTSDFASITDEWIGKFFKSQNDDDLIALIDAANFLDYKSLHDHCLGYIASRFFNKTLL